MAADIDTLVPVEARWPAVVIGLGAAVGIAGLVERDDVAPVRMLCHLNAQRGRRPAARQSICAPT
jgi:hypothetical protein